MIQGHERRLLSLMNEAVPFLSTKLQVPVAALPWPENRESVSVNSFGIGGANAHVRVLSQSNLRDTLNETGHYGFSVIFPHSCEEQT